MLTASARNAALNALDAVTWLSLHSVYSSIGTNELVGGDPAYVRKATSFTPAADGVKTMVELVTFDVPADSTVAWIGLWTDVVGGTLWGMVPNGGTTSGPPRQFVTDNPSDNQLKAPAHGLTTGESIVVWGSNDGPLPVTSGGTLSEGMVYYAGLVSADAFTISPISGGVVLDLITVGQGYFQRITPQFFFAQGTFRLNALTFTAVGV